VDWVGSKEDAAEAMAETEEAAEGRRPKVKFYIMQEVEVANTN